MVSRYEYLQALAPKITDELVVTTIAGIAREWGSLKDRDGNLYQVYMGGATSVALGVALALPHRRVICLDGDGSLLMGLAVLPVIAQANPSNLTVIVIDNEVYEAAGKIPTFTAGCTDLAKVAEGAGISNARVVRGLPEFAEALDQAFRAKGASFIAAKAQEGWAPIGFRALQGAENKYRFVRYVEKTENIEIIKPPARSALYAKKDGR